MKVSRRGFMQGAGAVAGMSGIEGMLAKCAFAAEQAKAAQAMLPAGVMMVKSTCVQCVAETSGSDGNRHSVKTIFVVRALAFFVPH